MKFPRDARRNVNGGNITELRKLFGGHCKYLDGAVVDISRRARALGQHAPVTFAHSMEATRLRRHNKKFTGQNQIIEGLLDNHESMICALSDESSGAGDEHVDIDTAEFISVLLGQHVEMARVLRDWLPETDLVKHEKRTDES